MCAGKFETLESDAAFVLEQAGLLGRVKRPWANKQVNKRNGDQDPSLQYFQQISKKQVQDLFDIYRLDFEMFDYSAQEYFDLFTQN